MSIDKIIQPIADNSTKLVSKTVSSVANGAATPIENGTEKLKLSMDGLAASMRAAVQKPQETKIIENPCSYFAETAFRYNCLMDPEAGFLSPKERKEEMEQLKDEITELDEYIKVQAPFDKEHTFCRAETCYPKDTGIQKAHFQTLLNSKIGDIIEEPRFYFTMGENDKSAVLESYGDEETDNALIRIKAPEGSKLCWEEKIIGGEKHEGALFPRNSKFRILDKKVTEQNGVKSIDILYEYIPE